MPSRLLESNAVCASITAAGFICSGTGSAWYMRDWQSPSPPQSSFIIVRLSMRRRMAATHLALRMSTSRPGPWKRCPAGRDRGARVAASTAAVSWNWAVVSSPPCPGISPSKSASITALWVSQPATKASTSRASRSNSSGDGSRTPATSWDSDKTRKGHCKELISTKGSTAALAAVPASPAMSSSKSMPVSGHAATAASGADGRSANRPPSVAGPVTDTRSALNFPRCLPSSAFWKRTFSPIVRSDWETSSDRCTKTSSPPPSGSKKP
mmetsp:Transcript_27483/g.81918  ORF Transcript_27483/g.81918 Transcript_27483/m.81918 type:complete len:268 (-) Transcript_27483:158-961(-)